MEAFELDPVSWGLGNVRETEEVWCGLGRMQWEYSLWIRIMRLRARR